MIARTLSAFLALVLSLPLFAATYTVSPASSPTGGGTPVTITITDGSFGTGPFRVHFGTVWAQSTERVDEHTLRAVSPMHMPATVDVTIAEGGRYISTGQQFTFYGGVPSLYERVLVPLLLPPVFGAFGSEFRTDLLVSSSLWQVPLWGLEWNRDGGAQCPPVSACIFPDDPVVAVGDPLRPDWVRPNGSPGRFIYMNKDYLKGLSMNLRVYDVSRAGLNFGTEIPIVRDREFVPVNDKIVFQNVPTDPRFRNTLRIYSGFAQGVIVTINGEEQLLGLAGGKNIYEPAYLQISDFPVNVGPIQVSVQLPPLGPISADIAEPFWAFMSVTNNETQLITTITPQP